jgi:hypothetical protein
VYLSRSSTGPNTGEFTLGGTNPSKYTGDFSYTNISPAGNDSWAIPMDDIAFDGKSANVKGKLGYIDTGTSYIFGNRDEVKAFHALVPGSASDDGISWKVPCDTSKEISFTFSGKAWKVLPEDWISAKDGAGVCMSNIHGREVVSNGWLLGDVFLKNVYTVFDMDKPGVGEFYESRPPSSGPPADVRSRVRRESRTASGSEGNRLSVSFNVAWLKAIGQTCHGPRRPRDISIGAVRGVLYCDSDVSIRRVPRIPSTTRRNSRRLGHHSFRSLVDTR